MIIAIKNAASDALLWLGEASTLGNAILAANSERDLWEASAHRSGVISVSDDDFVRVYVVTQDEADALREWDEAVEVTACPSLSSTGLIFTHGEVQEIVGGRA